MGEVWHTSPSCNAINLTTGTAERAGRFSALIALATLTLAGVGAFLLINDHPHLFGAWMALCCISGAAVIHNALQKWEQQNRAIKGRTAAMILTAFLAVFALGGVVGIFSEDKPSSNAGIPRPDPEQVLRHGVKLSYTWEKGGFDNVMIADFKVENPTLIGFKDFDVTCTQYGPSGTALDSNTRTIYQAVPARSKRTIPAFNMGFLHNQAHSTTCEVTNFVVQ